MTFFSSSGYDSGLVVWVCIRLYSRADLRESIEAYALKMLDNIKKKGSQGGDEEIKGDKKVEDAEDEEEGPTTEDEVNRWLFLYLALCAKVRHVGDHILQESFYYRGELLLH